MNAPRIIWRRAHQVRIKDRFNTPPHNELRAARTYDLIREQQRFAEEFAEELERELQEVR